MMALNGPKDIGLFVRLKMKAEDGMQHQPVENQNRTPTRHGSEGVFVNSAMIETTHHFTAWVSPIYQYFLNGIDIVPYSV